MACALTLICLTGCASLKGTKRASLGTLAGAIGGGVAGAAFSPNDESRSLNALVFGLTGALAGGVAALISEPKSEEVSTPKSPPVNPEIRAFQISGPEKLPDFVKRRLKPVVIEEYVEADQLGEDGSLHEPHKVYRIKHNAELITRPIESGRATSGEAK